MRVAPRRKAVESGFVLGIDQSYSGFGVCLLGADGMKVVSEHKGFSGAGVDRLIGVGDWLHRWMDWHATGPIRHVCMEGYAPGAKFGRELAGELGAVVKIRLREALGVPAGFPTIVAPMQVKKYATGRGSKVAKNEMLLAVYKKWGEEFRDDNECDSYTLAKIAHALHYGGDQLVYEREITDKLRRHTEWRRD